MMTTQTRILAAARELFGTRGFEATSVRQIAERCGLTDAAVLYHFHSKERILSALWLEHDPGQPPQVPPVATSLAAQVDTIVAHALRDAARRDAAIRLLVRQTLAGDELANSLRSRNADAWLAAVETLFEGTHTPEVAVRMADALFMLVVGTILRGQIEHGSAFPALCEEPQFKAEVQRLARAVVGISDHEAA